MKIEKLKQKAREHEQREEWRKAMDLYTEALNRADDEDDADIALHNRMGDLRVRVGDLDGAVEAYQQAIDLYLEADLPNNALAVCRKLERNAPDRPSVILRMGQIRVRQGFVVDARKDFLNYAERQLTRGDSDEALRALEEFASLVPDDVEIRLFLAGHLQNAEREDDAVVYLRQAHRTLAKEGKEDRIAEVRARIEELAPGLDLDAEHEEDSRRESMDTVDLGLAGFETTSLSGMELSDEVVPEEKEDEEEDEEEEGTDDLIDLEGEPVEAEEHEDPIAALEGAVFDLDDPKEADPQRPDALDEEDSAPPLQEDPEEALEDLPLLDDFSDLSDASPEPLPDLEAERPDAEGEHEGIPLLEKGLGDPADVDPDREPEPLDSQPEPESIEALQARIETDPGDGDAWRRLGIALTDLGQDENGREALERAHRAYGEAGDPEKAMRVLRDLIFHDPDEIRYYQRLVEYAHRTNDRALLVPAFLELAEALARAGATQKAEAVYGRVLDLDPRNPRARAALAPGEIADETPAPARAGSEDFVNLGGMVLDEPDEQSFRWKVADADPTGDEEADFARMLTQFKEKVARNVPSDDATAHYDLGAAYKEMGLLEEAVGQFQRAIRAHPANLAAYEMVGQCFLEKGEPEIAVRTLGRALDVEYQVEEDLLGIYYYLGKAHEEVGNSDSAREFYERVFSLDINFMDVTERLRGLR